MHDSMLEEKEPHMKLTGKPSTVYCTDGINLEKLVGHSLYPNGNFALPRLPTHDLVEHACLK